MSETMEPRTTIEQNPLGSGPRRDPKRPPRGFALDRGVNPWRDSLLRRMLAIADLSTALFVAGSLALFPGGTLVDALWAAVFAPAWILLAKLSGLYDRDQRSLRHLTVDELPAILVWTLASTAALTLFLTITPAGSPGIPAALRSWGVAIAFAVVLRGLARWLWRRLVPRERTLIVGIGPLADATRRKLELFPDIHVEVVDQVEEIDPIPGLDVDRIIVASQSIDETLLADLLEFCRDERIKLSVVPPARGMFGTAVRLNHVADLSVVEYTTWDVSRSTLFLKRVLDLVVGSVALLLFLPVFLVVAVAIRIETRGPAIFTQSRAGMDGRPFKMRKFRTMDVDAEAKLPQLVPFDSLRDPMFKLPNDPRVTRVGRVLRRWSLDELPQLFNVVRGSMSLVGPRPEQVELVARYAPEQRFRLMVKPGLTGPMQVYGRGRLTFDERLAVEREYIENLSLRRDLHLMALTLSAVVSGKGAF
jgi:exopolysaccharide biosynthesis polyprenyl glycosylphosphotransferase